MGFTNGSSCFVQPYFSKPLFSFHNSELKQRRPRTITMASSSKEDSETHSRRAILFVAISVLPFFQLKAEAIVDPPLMAIRKRARAFEAVKERDAEPKKLEEKPKIEPLQPVIKADEILPTKEKEELMLPKEIPKAEERPKSQEIPKAEESPKSQETPKPEELKKEATGNGFVGLLNGVGIISSGVLGAFYSIAQKEKEESNATIETMKTEIKKKEAAMVSIEKGFESKLESEKEESKNKLNKAREDKESVMNQLSSANSTISGLEQELKSERRSIEQLRAQIESLGTSLSMEREDKRIVEESLKEKLVQIEDLEGKINSLNSKLMEKLGSLRKLESSLAEKESEVEKLKTVYKRVNDDLTNASSEIRRLKDELARNEKEIESKNSVVSELNSSVSALSNEKENLKSELDTIRNEYKDLKSSSEEKSAFDAKVLKEREVEIQEVKAKLDATFSEVCKNQDVIAELTRENEHLSKTLDSESDKIKILMREINNVQEKLVISRDEAAELGQKLADSNQSCIDLRAELTRAESEFSSAKLALQKSLDEAEIAVQSSALELEATKKLLEAKTDELKTVSIDMSSISKQNESLRRVLAEAHQREEIADNHLHEEKRIVGSLEKQIGIDKEARKSLESDLEESTKSLDEMNRKALVLSKDLEMANARASELEYDKQTMYESLTEQKSLAREARENLEDAHSLVMSLGKERESLEKRGKRLESELAAAKGEILRLRSKVKPVAATKAKKVVDENESEGEAEAEAEENGNVNVTVGAKKVGRRKRSG